MRKFLFILLSLIPPFLNLSALDRPIGNKAIVFDFGGVIVNMDRKLLVDHLCTLFDVCETECERILEEFRKAKKSGMTETQAWTHCAQKHQIKLPFDWKEQFEKITSRSLIEIDGMLDLVKSYKHKGYRVALFSNVSSDHAEFLRTRGYYDQFFPVVLSCEIGADKPDPTAYQIMLSQVQVAPENCIFIDDKPENIEAAITLGIDGILFKNYEQLKADLDRRLVANHL